MRALGKVLEADERWYRLLVCSMAFLAVLAAFAAFAKTMRREPSQFHHCVVRQTDVAEFGWSVVVEGEVGAIWRLPSREYREPGTGLYVGLFDEGWRICGRPK